MPRWTAVLQTEAGDVDLPAPDDDTLRAIEKKALDVASYVGLDEVATLVVYKETAKDGRRRDRSYRIENTGGGYRAEFAGA